jgi:hypothetical protein
MSTFVEFESAFAAALRQERSDLQGLSGASEAQLTAWIRHLFQEFLGYTHWKEITSEGSGQVGSKGSKQLFPDLRVQIAETGLIFIECKRFGRLEGTRGKEEYDEASAQLKSYIRAHIDQAAVKPKMVMGIVTDGNRWTLLGLDRQNEFHKIADWSFLTDDPHILAQHMWLLAKPALAQPTSAVVEYLARKALEEVLKENARFLTRKVNERLPEGSISEELVGRWLRGAIAEPVPQPRPATTEMPPQIAENTAPPPAASVSEEVASEPSVPEGGTRRIIIGDLLSAGLLQPTDTLLVEGHGGRKQAASLTAEGGINVSGQVFDSPSAAAIRALELAGKTVRAINGWQVFRVLRSGVDLGSLLEIRSSFEDRKEADEAAAHDSTGTEDGQANQEATIGQLKPLLGLLPEVTVTTSKSAVTFYIGKIAIAYARPRKRGLPRLDIYVGDNCPDWCSPHSTYAAWCDAGDWSENIPKVVELIKLAPRHRSDDMALGKEPYRRRAESPTPSIPANSVTLG